MAASRTDTRTIKVYHYTEAKSLSLIVSSGFLKPSLEETGDAQFGDGQYFTDLTPEEASAFTRHQVSRALFDSPWHWGGRAPFEEIVWLEFAVSEDRIKGFPLFRGRVATAYPERRIFLYPNRVSLQLSGIWIADGVVTFRLSPSERH